MTDVRRDAEWVPLTKPRFRERFMARFYDPVFADVAPELEQVFEKAWDGYNAYRKSPRTTPAGPGFADPAQKLSLEWLATRAASGAAQARHDLFTQIEHAALSLATMTRRIRTGAYESPSAGLHPPREK